MSASDPELGSWALLLTPTSLAARFELAIAPSATIWKVLSEAGGDSTPRTGRGLLIADPTHPIGDESPALLRSLRNGLRGLGPLPHAREEARAARRALAADGEPPQCGLASC